MAKPEPPRGDVRYRSDGRKHDTGREKPYRPKPADFRETYISMGWDGLEDHYRTNWRVIRRWIEEEGRDELKAARAEHVRQIYAARKATNRAKRYVLGRTLAPRSPPSAAAAQVAKHKPFKQHIRALPHSGLLDEGFDDDGG